MLADGDLLAAIEKLTTVLERHSEKLDKVMSLRVRIHELGYTDGKGNWVPYPSRQEQLGQFLGEIPHPTPVDSSIA